MIVLGLDVGTKRIGVAISDPSESFALPLAVMERTNLRDDVKRIAGLAREHQAGELAVGDPLRLSGERGPASESVDRFIAALEKHFEGKIHRVDERLTTAQATRTLVDADVSRAKRKQIVDKIAATLILETFLNRRRGARGK
ncbi:MAG: Holliday junction resolvase RuvX [Candidatus Eremiobacteraeota bacterium]|nr:Holliday junction resolvase RuvX [Candidatus Eremiobacteraeota bacterium]